MATTWECAECGQKKTSLTELERHKINVHGVTLKQPLREYEVPKVDYKRGKNEDQKN